MVDYTIQGYICIITLDRPHAKNAIDRETANELEQAFIKFESDETLRVAILTGSNETFCAGADLKAFANGKGNELYTDMSKTAPLGPTRMQFKKPVIAAIAGHAVAGGFELACLCDLRIMEEDATLGVFCRRFGVPLIDGGTQRLPRLIGLSRALDLILTGRPVNAKEAFEMGLANRVVAKGQSLNTALQLANEIASFPQQCMLNDREATIKGMDLSFEKGMQLEFLLGLNSISTGEALKGANEFSTGKGRHGSF